MARPSNREQRRRQISTALVKVMAEHGYHRASIAKVAREAGLATGLVLYHFDSKADILVAAVTALVDQFQRRYEERVARAHDDPRRQIDAFIDAHLALDRDADSGSVAAWVVIASEAVRDKNVRAVYSRSVATRLRELERVIRAAHAAEGVRSGGARRIAAAIMSAIEGSFVLSVAAPGALPKGYAAPMMRAMAAGLLG